MSDAKFKEAMEKLPPKQQVFVRAYLANGLNATRAYIEAGYSAKTAEICGPRLLGNARIREAIQLAADKRAAKLDITAEYVLQNIVKIGERCMQAEPVLDKEGNPTGEYTFNANGALKAQELLGKNLKLFTDRVEVDLADDLVARLEAAKARARGKQ